MKEFDDIVKALADKWTKWRDERDGANNG